MPTKEKFNVTVPLGRRGTAYRTGPHREAPELVRARKEQGEGQPTDFIKLEKQDRAG